MKKYVDRSGYIVQETDDFVTFVDEFGLLELRKYQGTDKIVYVPNGINEISIDAFNGKPVEQVIIPDTVMIINSRAFMNCNKLGMINIPESVERIHDQAFDGCTNMEDVSFPMHLELLGQYAFRNTGLKIAVFPKGIKHVIGGPVFVSCHNLKNAVIEEPDITLNTGEFSKCPDLKEIAFDGEITQLPPIIRLQIEKGNIIILGLDGSN